MLLTQRIHNINELASDYFTDALFSTKTAYTYVANRCSRSTIEKFNIGFAPKNNLGLVKSLNSKTDDEEAIIASGLIFQDDASYSYDFFYNRIMFPILSGTRIIGFGGRTVGNAFPKYINTKKTVIYNKSRILFGVQTTRAAIQQKRKAILVEGYFDLVVLYDHQIKNCAALCGTAFTPDHGRLLQRYADKVYIMLDGDAGGGAGTARAKKVLKHLNIYGGKLLLPPKTDPEDFIRKYGKNKFKSLEIKK